MVDLKICYKNIEVGNTTVRVGKTPGFC
jgi:hypothetical protein